jgi:hypothetical protein
MIIGISGKIGAGKDTVGKIIQYLLWTKSNLTEKDIITLDSSGQVNHNVTIQSGFEIKKFADKLKDIVCILLGCTKKQLEDREFKERELGEEWWKYVIKKGQKTFVIGLYTKYFSTKEEADFFRRGELSKYTLDYNADDFHVDIEKLTPRKILQLLGTECGREIIHPNIWVNALFANYRTNFEAKNAEEWGKDLTSNWIITDVRFPNEAQAIKDRGGILIRVNKPRYTYESDLPEKSSPLQHAERGKELYNHPSEIALDNAEFDYVINNNGTIEELIEKVKNILIKEKIIK